MTRKKPKSEHKPDGRPTVMTKDVLSKLEDAFINAYTDEMACLYAGISETALYDYCANNPKFAKRKEVLKMSPDLRAQQTILKDLDTVGGARYWAEHRMPQFMPTSKVILGGAVVVQEATPGDEAIKAITDKYEKDFEEAVAEQIRKKYRNKKENKVT